MRPQIFPTDFSFLFSFHLPLSVSSPTRGVLFGSWFFWGVEAVGDGMVSLGTQDPKPVSWSLLLLRLWPGQALVFQSPKPPGSSLSTENHHNPAAIFLRSAKLHKTRTAPHFDLLYPKGEQGLFRGLLGRNLVWEFVKLAARE